ncbi:hypothetical protein ABZP36_021296 [Zizania latifolia]
MRLEHGHKPEEEPKSEAAAPPEEDAMEVDEVCPGVNTSAEELGDEEAVEDEEAVMVVPLVLVVLPLRLLFLLSSLIINAIQPIALDVIGIDLGTTNSCVSVMEGKGTRLLESNFIKNTSMVFGLCLRSLLEHQKNKKKPLRNIPRTQWHAVYNYVQRLTMNCLSCQVYTGRGYARHRAFPLPRLAPYSGRRSASPARAAPPRLQSGRSSLWTLRCQRHPSRLLASSALRQWGYCAPPPEQRLSKLLQVKNPIEQILTLQDDLFELEETLQAVNIVLLQFRAVLFAAVPKSSRGVVPGVAGARGLVEKSRVEAEGKKNGQQRSDTEKIDLLKFIDRTRQHMQGWIFMSCWIPQGDRRKYHDCVSVMVISLKGRTPGLLDVILDSCAAGSRAISARVGEDVVAPGATPRVHASVAASDELAAGFGTSVPHDRAPPRAGARERGEEEACRRRVRVDRANAFVVHRRYVRMPAPACCSSTQWF